MIVLIYFLNLFLSRKISLKTYHSVKIRKKIVKNKIQQYMVH